MLRGAGDRPRRGCRPCSSRPRSPAARRRASPSRPARATRRRAGSASASTGPGPLSVAMGTSGVVFAALPEYRADPQARVHAFCHAVPGAWHQMGVMLSAAGSLAWLRGVVGGEFSELTAEAERWEPGTEGLTFLPYLTGERTPHADPDARGAFTGLEIRHDRGALVRAVLEGVACGLRDSFDLVGGGERGRVSGGGARSELWLKIVASVLEIPLERLAVEEGAAYGAALLGGVAGGLWSDVHEAVAACVRTHSEVEPVPEWIEPVPRAAGALPRAVPGFAGNRGAPMTATRIRPPRWSATARAPLHVRAVDRRQPRPRSVRRADARAGSIPVDSVHKLAELGAWGVSLHDDDLIPWGVSAAERDRIVARFKARARGDRAWAWGWRRRTCSVTRHSRTARSRPTTAACGARRSARRCASSTSPPSSAPRSTSSGAGARAPRRAWPRTRATRWSATARRSTCSRDYVRRQRLRPALRDGAQAQRAARGHLPADRRPRAALHRDAQAPGDGRRQPRGRARDDGRACPSTTRSARRCGRASSSTSTSTGSGSAATTRTSASARRTSRRAFLLVRLLERAGYAGPLHFDAHSYRNENADGVWDFAAGCMSTYRALAEQAAHFDSLPEVQEALAAASTPELALASVDGDEAESAEGRGLGARRPGRARLLQRAAGPTARRRAPRRALRLTSRPACCLVGGPVEYWSRRREFASHARGTAS